MSRTLEQFVEDIRFKEYNARMIDLDILLVYQDGEILIINNNCALLRHGFGAVKNTCKMVSTKHEEACDLLSNFIVKGNPEIINNNVICVSLKKITSEDHKLGAVKLLNIDYYDPEDKSTWITD